MTLCNKNDQTWFSDTLTRAEPLGVVKTLAFQDWVSAPPSGPADVNAYKNMFDHYINTQKKACKSWLISAPSEIPFTWRFAGWQIFPQNSMLTECTEQSLFTDWF